MRGGHWEEVIIVCVALGLGLHLAGLTPVRAERLPIRYYTTDDGLAHDRVKRIVRDSQGFLWFCTLDGLSRFDGQRFTTYRLNEGFVQSFNDFLETRQGEYWAATNGSGACRFNQSLKYPPSEIRVREKPRETESLFTVYPVGDMAVSNRVNVLYEDRRGSIWAGTDGGLFALDRAHGETSFVPVALGIMRYPDALVQVWAITEDAEGSLWIGTKYGLVRRLPDGQMIHYDLRPSPTGTDTVWSLFKDEEGRVWISHQAGLIVLKPLPASATQARHRALWLTLIKNRTPSPSELSDVQLPVRPGQARWLTVADGLGSNEVLAVRQLSDGKFYMITTGGYLTEFDSRRFKTYSTAQGVNENLSLSMAEDIAGNLWIATFSAGAMMLAGAGLVTYTKADGLWSDQYATIFEDAAGDLYCWGDGWRIHRFDGRGFTSVKPKLPKHITDADWRTYHQILKDRTGEWWIATSDGLYRFPQVRRFEQLAHTPPKAVYTTRDGLAGNDVTRLFEDSRGDIWIGTFAPDREVVTRWERATGLFHRYSDADGLPRLERVSAFGEDNSANVWIGFFGGGLARYRAGRFTLFTSKEGLVGRTVFAIHRDLAGRLWISLAAPNGLYYVADPTAERPHFARTTVANALAGSFEAMTQFGAITEDEQGRIYFGATMGIGRLDPQTGHVRRYTTADGLAAAQVLSAYRDRKGNLWFGTIRGLSRLTPQPDRPASPSPAFISGLRIGGISHPISVFGQSAVSILEIGPDQNQIQIDFFGLSSAAGGLLRYQYKLEGADQDWSAPTDQRTVHYAKLSPGTYRFLVRAVSADGVASPTPATVSFTILPPIWQRWWFLTLMVTVIGLVIYAIHRYRVARLLELERVRTRIATDLHDDIGASLSRIAILSEVVKQHNTVTRPESAQMLTQIAEMARELVGTMSDIVWSIDPRHDDLSNVILRIANLASQVLETKGIACEIQMPSDPEKVKLTLEQRRHLYLIFKEAINNIVRYADCTSVRLTITITESQLQAEIADNGRGFVEEDGGRQIRQGHGLENMRVRTAQLGGQLRIDSTPGHGTRLTLTVPLR
ncbi:MAG: two-component regulator propeller domain-containing protein [Acidobacteriota bacterium]|nr:two-component regulator propeller domain-containing protein [Acidobacteriota bacterium]